MSERPELLALLLDPRWRSEDTDLAELRLALGSALSQGADPNASMPDDELPGARATALAAATLFDDAECIETLLAAGAEVNDGAALALALARNNQEAVEALLAAGADINAAAGPAGETALHYMLDRAYHRPALERLLRRGPDLEATAGPLGERPLHTAARRRRCDAIAQLAEAGCDLNATTSNGDNAYRHSVRRTFEDVCELLAKLGCDTALTPFDELAIALLGGELKVAAALLEEQSNLLRDATPDEQRLLGDLASLGKTDAVRLAVEHGADLAWPALDGGTALHQTAWFGQPDTAAALIALGAPLEVHCTAHDSTPLGWCAHGSRYSGGAKERIAHYVAIAEMLIEAGAQLGGPDGGRAEANFRAAAPAVAEVLRRHGWDG